MALPSQDHIFVRSPFIIEVDDPTQTGSKVEIFIYKANALPPVTPTYTLSKLIPASNNTVTLYNLSPYIRENITHPTSPDNASTNLQLTPYEEYTLVDVATYNLIGGNYVAEFTATYKAFDGYGNYETGINPDYSYGQAVVLAEQMTYNYYYDPAYPTTSESLAGTITAYLGVDYTVEYTGLQTLTNFSYVTTSADAFDLFRVPSSMISEGAKVVILGIDSKDTNVDGDADFSLTSNTFFNGSCNKAGYLPNLFTFTSQNVGDPDLIINIELSPLT